MQTVVYQLFAFFVGGRGAKKGANLIAIILPPSQPPFYQQRQPNPGYQYLTPLTECFDQ
jgi:hypothetical protein